MERKTKHIEFLAAVWARVEVFVEISGENLEQRGGDWCPLF